MKEMYYIYDVNSGDSNSLIYAFVKKGKATVITKSKRRITRRCYFRKCIKKKRYRFFF